MAGLIVGSYGFQRSGKSTIAFLIAESCFNKGIKVYTNQDVEGYIKLEKLIDIPINNEPKVLWLDEADYFLDSRNWQDNKESSIYFNSIGKMNILLLLTTTHPDQIEMRLRRQHNYVFMVKGDEHYIYYRLKDIQRNMYADYMVRKDEKLFSRLRFESNLVPDWIDCNIREFNRKVMEFKAKYRYEKRKLNNYKFEGRLEAPSEAGASANGLLYK